MLLRAPRGLLGAPPPLIPDEVAAYWVARAPGLVDEVVDDTNHYLIALRDREASLVADRVRTAATARG